MEKEIIIDTPDGHKIYGFLSTPKEKPDKLVIFVHGFTGNCNEHIFFNGAKYLRGEGIANFRFDLYNWQKGGRTFTDCDIQTHVDDLKTVVEYFKNKFKKIYLIGHSLGGIVVLQAGLDVDGIVLWDPSHAASFIGEDDYEYNEGLGAYLLKWGVVFVVGKKMHDDKLQYTAPEILMAGIKCPIKIICAGNGVLKEGGKNYYSLAKEPKELVIIEGAGHTFDEDGVEEKLFAETAEWVDRF